jgi:hypothetical protein
MSLRIVSSKFAIEEFSQYEVTKPQPVDSIISLPELLW